MADKIEPVVEINIANVFKQLHDTALKQANPPKGFEIKNLAFADDKATKMKAGEYLITLQPISDKSKLYIDDTNRQDAEKALVTYVKFFVNKKVDPKEFSEITVDVPDDGSASKDKKEPSKDDSNKKPEDGEKPEDKKPEGGEKPSGESLRIKSTRNSLLTNLFDDYSADMLTEEGEGSEGGGKKEEPKDAGKKDAAPEKGSAPKSTKKVQGLSTKYTCQLAGQKTGSLAGAMKKGVKSLFGGIWNDLTQIKITGGVFGKEGLAVGKILDPDAWKEAAGRPDIDANTIKSDIDTVMQKDFPGNTVFVTIHKCLSLLSDLKKNKVEMPSGLAKVLTETDFCITLKCQKSDENYDSYNEKSIAEVLNKSIGNYYKSILTHPLKFTISDKDIFKVEGYGDANKDIKAPKDKQTPNKTKKESMSFLAYCKLSDLIVEDGEEPKGDDVVKKVNEKLLGQVRKNVKADVVVDAPTEKDVLYGKIKEIVDKVKWLKPDNSGDIANIETEAEKNKNTHAFFIDLAVKNNEEKPEDKDEEKPEDTAEEPEDNTEEGSEESGDKEPGLNVDSINVKARYAKLLNLLFEDLVEEAEGELSQLLAEDLTNAVKETMTQLSKKVEIPNDYKPIVFNYYAESGKKSNESKLFDFIYKGKILNESSKLLVEGHCIEQDYIDKLITKADFSIFDKKEKGKDTAADKLRDAYKKHLEEIKSEPGSEYQKFKKYISGIDTSSKNWVSKELIGKLQPKEGNETTKDSVKKLFDQQFSERVGKTEEVRPEIYALLQALEDVTGVKVPRVKKITIQFFDSDPKTGEKDKDPFSSIEVTSGKSLDKIDDKDAKDTISEFKDAITDDRVAQKDGYRFDRFEPGFDEVLDDDTDVVAKYEKKSKPIEITFYDVDPENPDDEKKWKDIDVQELDPENPKDIEFPTEKDLDEHKGWKFEKWEPSEEELKKNPPKEETKVKATYSKSTITISLYDADPDTGKKLDDPIATYEIEKGDAPNAGDGGTKFIPDAVEELQKKAKELPKGTEYTGEWVPDAKQPVEDDTELIAKYVKKDVTHKVKFMAPTDPDDPSTAEDIGEEQTIKDGESAEAPEPPEVEGWKFDKWDTDDWQNVKDDITVVAEYKKPITITFKVPKDPEKPDGEMEEVGDPIEFEEGKPIEAPEPPEREGYEFEKWDPDPADLKPEESTDVIGTYKKKDNIEIIFKVPKDPEKPDGDTEQVGDPIIYKDGEEITPPDPPEKEGYEFDKWDPDPKGLKPEESTEITGTYKKKDDKKEPEDEEDNKVLHEVYVFIDIANLAKPKDAIMIDLYAPKNPAKADEKGPVDVGNGKYKKIESVPVEKGKEFLDKLKGKEPDFTKDGYEFKDWVPAKVKDGKQPKTLDDVVNAGGGPVVATYAKKEGDEENANEGENNDLYIYVSKKIKYKNEKSVGRKDKKMMNGNAYNT